MKNITPYEDERMTLSDEIELIKYRYSKEFAENHPPLHP